MLNLDVNNCGNTAISMCCLNKMTHLLYSAMPINTINSITKTIRHAHAEMSSSGKSHAHSAKTANHISFPLVFICIWSLAVIQEKLKHCPVVISGISFSSNQSAACFFLSYFYNFSTKSVNLMEIKQYYPSKFGYRFRCPDSIRFDSRFFDYIQWI